MAGRRQRLTCRTLRRFTSTIVSTYARSSVWNVAGRSYVMPAPCTTSPTPPSPALEAAQRSSSRTKASAASPSVAAKSRTRRSTSIVPPVRSWMPRCSSTNLSSFLPIARMHMPCSDANMSQKLAPIPPVAPVTTAHFPYRSTSGRFTWEEEHTRRRRFRNRWNRCCAHVNVPIAQRHTTALCDTSQSRFATSHLTNAYKTYTRMEDGSTNARRRNLIIFLSLMSGLNWNVDSNRPSARNIDILFCDTARNQTINSR
mmetsp:Transcript_20590/g.41217  ORF Transcript_20590/g.41217 Transcript_20590/m.41217 type:complete len:257 (+) Transcript_20590:470-1240(+)